MADDDYDALLRQVEASMGTPGSPQPSAPVPTKSAPPAPNAGDGVPVSRVVGALVAGGVAGAAVWLVLSLASGLIIPAVLVTFVAVAIAWLVRG